MTYQGRPMLVQDLLLHTSGLANYTGQEWQGTRGKLQAAISPQSCQDSSDLLLPLLPVITAKYPYKSRFCEIE